MMEFPVYRNPGIRVILRHMWSKGAHYLKKMGGVILMASMVIWALGYFPRDVEYSKDYATPSSLRSEQLWKRNSFRDDLEQNVTQELISTLQRKEAERQEHSYIGRLGKSIEPVIRPLGFDWKMGISLVTGFAAKEIVVSTMGVLYQADVENVHR